MKQDTRIREEWREEISKLLSRYGGAVYEGIEGLKGEDQDVIEEEIFSKMDELLKSQREELVERLPECAWCDLENGRGKYLLESDVINLIKE